MGSSVSFSPLDIATGTGNTALPPPLEARRLDKRLLAIVERLRHRLAVVAKQDGDLLVRLLADVDSAVNAAGRLIPIRLPPA